MNGGRMLGVSELRRAVQKIAAKFPDRVGAALYQEAQIEMTESKRRCPVSPTPAPKGVVPGTLRATGTVWPPVREGRYIIVKLSYGTTYAIVQHENPDYLHTTGQWKFLESVLQESRSFMAARLAARLQLNAMKAEGL